MSKQKILQDMLGMLKPGRSTADLARIFVRDTDDQNVPLAEPEAKDVIGRRLAELEGVK